MRIRDIHIDGFGQFAGREIGPLERSVTVLYGPNEAGKSTLLEFVRRVLFGFPRKSGNVNTYPAMAGGSYGGSITVEDTDGRPYVVRRTKGKIYSGEVAVISESGNQLPETELKTLLGSHSRDVFEQVFAFTLAELYSDDLLNDANVNSQIYSAGMGVTALPNAIKSIVSKRRDIFLKSGTSQKIYTVHSKLEEIEKKLEEVAGNAVRYGNLTTRLQQVDTKLERSAAHRQQIKSQYSNQVTLQNAWEAWNDLISAERALAALPVIGNFPKDGVNRLEALEERVRTAQREYQSADFQVAEAERTAEVRVKHEAILKYSVDIRRLQNGRTAFDGSRKDLPERETELESHKRTLAGTLKDLGPNWDEVQLREFDLSLAVRQEIAEHRDRLHDASVAHSSRRSILVQDKTALEEARDAESKAQRELEAAVKPSLDADRIRQRRKLIRATRSHLHEVDRHQQNVLNLQSQLEGLESTAPPAGSTVPTRIVATVSLIVGIALPIVELLVGGAVSFMGAVAGITLGGVAVYLFVSGKPGLWVTTESPLAGPFRDSLNRAETATKDLQSKMTQDAAPLNLKAIDEASLLAAGEWIDEQEYQLRERTRLSEALEAARDLANKRRARAEESAVAVENAKRQVDAAHLGWREWLKTRGLLDTFTPETAEVLQRQVELGRSRLGDVRSWQQRIEAIETDIREYVEAVEPLAQTFDITFERNDWDTVARAADRLVELLEETQEIVRRRTDAEAQLDDAKRQLHVRKSDLKKADEELKQLLRSGGAEDIEGFRVRAGQSERRAVLKEAARTALDRLQRLSAPGEPLETLKSDLGNTSRQSIGDEIARLDEERVGADAQREELLTERASILTELETLVDEEESSRMRMERNVLLEQIRAHARDWTRLTLAQNLIEEARRKFERERQPGVVRHAEEFFTGITDARYRQVYAPLGEQTITVTDADGRTKQPSELSRGTREQLFLSLRFGLVRELGQRTAPLPVIVDEVLVNFDPDRALRAAVAFTELSQTNQVLVFTCHPTIVTVFRKAASEAGTEEPEVVPIT